MTACTRLPVIDHDSYLYAVPVGSKLSLNKNITIPANLARRYFQYGKPVREKDVDIYYPHCNIVMNTLVDHERTIKPAVFEIYKVFDDDQEVRRYVYYADNFLSSDHGPVIVGFTSFYYLHSVDYPDVTRLECLQWNEPSKDQYLSINEVKKVLGDYFTLQISD